MKGSHEQRRPGQQGSFRPGGASTRASAGGPGKSDHGDSEIAQILKSTGGIDLWTGGERRTLRPDLLDREAQERAKALRGMSSSQLRRFYGSTVAFKQRLQIDPQITSSEVEAQVAYLKASSAYAGARKQPKALVEFFAAAANSVKTRDDYIAFAQHFEAVMAFHKVFEVKGAE